MSVDRRAVLVGALSAMAPLAAHASLAGDKAELSKEDADIKALDDTIKKERNLAFTDEVELAKANDAYLEALKKGNKKLAGELQAKIKALQAKYAEDEKAVLALQAEESEEIAVEEQTKKKVAADIKAELAVEDKEIIEAEEAVLKAEVGADTANFVSKFFK